MTSFAIASLTLLAASASAQAVGSAHVVNQCSYDVYLCNTPSANGGFQEQDTTLSPGGTWDQEYTQLTNGNGWSIKLSKTQQLENILQYEYTFQNDGTIWYDLSCVNGNPWDGDWMITSSTEGCSPRQAAYMYSTDDAFGMQACPQDASITVTLCSGDSAANSTSGSGSDSDSGSGSSSDSNTPATSENAAPPPAATTSAAAPAQPPPQQAPPAIPALPVHEYNWNNADASKSVVQAAPPSPTTLATMTTPAPKHDNNVVTVTDLQTDIVTNIVTAYDRRVKPRHEHHAHGHQHQA